jgi:predicted GTPase
MHLIDYVIEAGRAMVIAFNKCDLLTDDDKKLIKQKIELRMPFQIGQKLQTNQQHSIPPTS